MKKRVISMLMALCLMLTLVPAVMATEQGYGPCPIPNENTLPEVTVTEQPSRASVAMTASATVSDTDLTGNGTASTPYKVYTAAGFEALCENFAAISLEYTYIEIMNDIDLSNIDAPSTWNGYLMYFYGEITGANVSDGNNGTRPAKLSGLASDTFLIYGWFGGKISNLIFDLKGNTATLTYMCGKFNNVFHTFLMEDITVVSDTTVVLTGDNQANYAPFAFSVYGNFTMKNCVNKANISGNTYAGIFVGYYPLDPTGTFTFDHCINQGTITLKHAGMFFGNNSGLRNNAAAYALNEDDPSSSRIRFTGCANNGTINGTESAYLFSGRPGGKDDAVSDAYEDHLRKNGCMGTGSVECIQNDLNMTLTYNNQGVLTMTKATNSKTDIGYYMVSVYTYVNAYTRAVNDDTADYISNGNDRYGAQQKIMANATDTTLYVGYYGVCDYPADTEGLTFDDNDIDGVWIANYNGQKYYWIDTTDPYDVNENFASYHFVNGPGNYGVKNQPSFATLAAYSADGTLLGIVSATGAN